MNDISEFLKRVAKRTGFKRESYVEKNIPTEPSNVLAIPFYGDIRSAVILSSFILKNFKEANKDKYIILCSWPGLQHLFPYVDEYWTMEDESSVKGLATSANNFYNSSDTATEITRGLIEVLNVFTARDMRLYYDNGFTKKYWDEFKEIRRFLPEVPSANMPGFKEQMQSKEGKKVIVYPATRMKSWQNGKTEHLPVSKEFWIALIERLIKNEYVPVVYQNQFTYDMSRDFVERCLYLVPRNMSDVLAAFRYIGCVLDVHTGISRLAITARCPYVAVTERQVFVRDKDFELDDLCADGLPRQYIYSFSTQLMVGGPEEWEVSVLDNIMVRLKEFMATINPESLPSTASSYEIVPYTSVRQKKAKHVGMAFINSSKKK